MLADIMTKALLDPAFSQIVVSLGPRFDETISRITRLYLNQGIWPPIWFLWYTF